MVFKDPKLQAIFEENRNFALARIEKLDAISADIKAMEKLFSESAVPFLKVTEREVSLIYDNNKQKINIRLPQEELKPFIETKADIRLDYASLLPQLLKAAIKICDL